VPLSDESLFREVEQEVRNEQLQRLWDKYGIYLIAACLGVIVAVGGVKGWQAWERASAESAGAQYLEAVRLYEAEDRDAATAILRDLAEDGPAGYALLARFQMATAHLDAGDRDAALGVLDALSNDYGQTDLVGNLARIKAAYLMIDTAPYAEIEDRIGHIADAESPLRNAAREALALSAYRNGDYEGADRLYLEIRSDASAPQAMQDRARRMQELIEPRLLERLDDGAGGGSDPGAAGAGRSGPVGRRSDGLGAAGGRRGARQLGDACTDVGSRASLSRRDGVRAADRA